MSSLTVGDIVLTGTATGNFLAGGGTTVIGTSPISVATSGSTATVSLNASYQTAGSYATASHLHDANYVNVTGDTMSGNLYVSSATTTTTVGFGDIQIAKGTAYGIFAINAPTDVIHIRSKNGVEFIEQTGPNPVSLRTKSIGLNSSTTLPTLVDNGITFGDDANLYRSAANALKTDDALEVVGSLTNGGTAVSLSTHTHAYQPAGTYVTSVAGTAPIVASTTTAGATTVSVSTGTTSTTVAFGNHLHSGVYQTAGTYITAVNGTAPIAVSTTTAGVSTVSLTASYDSAGTAASAVSTHAAVTTSVHGITNTANLLTTTTSISTVATTQATATTISSTTATAPTDITGMQHVFTPTYDEDVLVNVNLVYTQTAASTAIIDLHAKVVVNGVIPAPGGFNRLGASHGSPTGLTMSFSHTFAAISGTPYTAKVACYKSLALGTYSASNISSFSITRVRA